MWICCLATGNKMYVEINHDVVVVFVLSFFFILSRIFVCPQDILILELIYPNIFSRILFFLPDSFSNSLINSSCFRVNFSGISILTFTNSSPLPG